MAKLKLSFDEYIPLRDIVFKTLREAIVTGELKPGERLMEIKLANEMGVSRTPVREAIRKLEQEGLVRLTARKGAEVAPINAKDLKEVLEIRKALEGLACQMACQHATEEQIQDLSRINQDIEKAIGDGDIERIARLDALFHDRIGVYSSNTQLIMILSRLKEHIYRYRLEFIADTRNKRQIIEEHEKIIQDITNKNEKAVRRDIEHHIEGQERYILNTLSTGEK